MDYTEYLNRINFSGDLKPSLNLLRNLQKAHLLTVPFENLDIHLHRKIELDTHKMYQKIVEQNRGGFCYELNGLFFELLTYLGFEVKRISARVFDKEKGYGPEFDHLALIVKMEEVEYLTDVGFGEFAFFPLKIEMGKEQSDPRGTFILDQYEAGFIRVNKSNGGKLNPEYIFKNEEKELIDFKEICDHYQSHPDSHFKKKRMISLPTKEGRVTLSGNILKTKEGDTMEESLIQNEKDYERKLWDFFGVRL